MSTNFEKLFEELDDLFSDNEREHCRYNRSYRQGQSNLPARAFTNRYSGPIEKHLSKEARQLQTEYNKCKEQLAEFEEAAAAATNPTVKAAISELAQRAEGHLKYLKFHLEHAQNQTGLFRAQKKDAFASDRYYAANNALGYRVAEYKRLKERIQDLDRIVAKMTAPNPNAEKELAKAQKKLERAQAKVAELLSEVEKLSAAVHPADHPESVIAQDEKIQEIKDCIEQTKADMQALLSRSVTESFSNSEILTKFDNIISDCDDLLSDSNELTESRKYATDTSTDYEMAYNNMDHFMTDDEEAVEQFYQITDCQELADFLDDNMTDMEAFLDYAGPEATLEGFADYIISNGLNQY